MGNYFGKSVQDTLKENQDFINEIHTVKIERQIQMKNQIREKEVALEIARQRELCVWYGTFYITAFMWAVVTYKYKRKLSYFSPLVPLSFLMGYQADLAYGTKLHRIMIEAEHILQFEPDIVKLPLGVPTAASLDLGRAESEGQKKLHPLLPPI